MISGRAASTSGDARSSTCTTISRASTRRTAGLPKAEAVRSANELESRICVRRYTHVPPIRTAAAARTREHHARGRARAPRRQRVSRLRSRCGHAAGFRWTGSARRSADAHAPPPEARRRCADPTAAPSAAPTQAQACCLSEPRVARRCARRRRSRAPGPCAG